MLCADVTSSLLLLDLPLLPVCKEEVSPEEPPQIKEEQEDVLDRPEEADGALIIDLRSVWPSGENFITADVKTLMFWSVDFHQINNTCERLLLGLQGAITASVAVIEISLYALYMVFMEGLTLVGPESYKHVACL